MKKEVSPALMITIIGVVLAGIVVVFLIQSGSLGGPKLVKPEDLSAAELRDDDPPKRGQPGYRERTTDAPTQ